MRESKFWPVLRDMLLLLAINFLGLQVMGPMRLIENLLAPGGSAGAGTVCLAVIFYFVRIFLTVFGPGWVLARIFWILTAPPLDELPTSGRK